MSLALSVAIPFLGAALCASASRFGRSIPAICAGLATFLALAFILPLIPQVLGGQVLTWNMPWLPAHNININFMLDGLGLLFALLILGIGLLIILFAHFYLDESEPKGQFYGYLMLFQGAMLGLVLSDNILMLLMFWEMTALSSFLLIGFWKHEPAARSGARMALAITGGGGLALFAGLLILGNIAGSYDLTSILEQRDLIQGSPLYLPALGLILLGAFTKSAQMPFHFWLPHAMAAPTPVSAYLHSATMVKAGIFILARLWPVLAGSDAWFYTVTTVGLTTMVVAACIALFKDDLKSILAYSTISHLGLITFLLGLGTDAGLAAAMVHILCHASFKAALFMISGIVEHAAHTRNLRNLGGLARLMPITFGIAAFASASMAGLPPLAGFLSKEMALTAAAQTHWLGNAWAVPLAATLGALLSVAYTFRFFSGIFGGAAKSKGAAKSHDPHLGMWVAPFILAAIGVLIGIAPNAMIGWLATAAAPQADHLAIWHGLHSSALWMSLFAIGGGILLLNSHSKLAHILLPNLRLDGKAGFDFALNWLTKLGSFVRHLHNGMLHRYVAIGLVAIMAASIFAVYGLPLPGLSRAATPANAAVFGGACALILVVVAAVRLHHQRMIALLLTGIAGLLISMGFAYFSAPDLALTQIGVELVTVILMLLALNYLPKTSAFEQGFLRRGGDAAIAITVGVGTAMAAFFMLRHSTNLPVISAFHLEQSKPAAGGTNAVNTIIVDFRGFDTYGEIIVLGIAALIVAAIVAGLSQKSLEGKTRTATPLMLRIATNLILPFSVAVGIYIFLRGHNQPGGGFVAGLIFAFGFLLQYLTFGQAAVAARKRIGHHGLIGAGILIASSTGIASWLAGLPFLTSTYGYVHLAPLNKFELASASMFDLGVFLCVLGAVLLSLVKIARISAPIKRGD